MTELLTAAQMRAIEQAAIDSGQVTGLELMERAGRAVVTAVFAEWSELGGGAPAPGLAALDPAWAGRGGAAPLDPPEYFLNKDGVLRAVVLCGPGNNGGDGFVVARLLKTRGWAVEVFLYGDAEKLPPDARVNFERWAELGAVSPLVDSRFDGAFEAGATQAIVIDAIFGTGLTRPFLTHRCLAMALNAAQARAKRGAMPKIVAVDFPSGMCADSGIWLGDDQPLDFAGLANLRVTFHRAKTGHFLADGPMSCGKIVVTCIGLD